MPDPHGGGVFDDVLAEVGNREQSDERATGLDLADDGEHVPELVGDAVAMQDESLRSVWEANAAEE
ncbi:MAG: hypothetical protein GY741_14255 [Phycisphaeraceae bacterium]|nr:hypothetical protein [Phycisphaeraceae bacterium]